MERTAALAADARCVCASAPRCPEHSIAPWYTPHAKQGPIHASRARYRSAGAGRRAGKTTAAGVEFRRSIARDLASGKSREIATPDLPIFDRGPALHYWVIAPQASLHRPARRAFLAACTRQERKLFGVGVRAGLRRSPTPAIWLPGDILVEFKSATDPESLVGEGLNGVWLTEAARLKPEVWDGNVRPALADFRGWVLADTTPLGRNWFYDEFWRRGIRGDAKYDPDYANFSWRTIDNTTRPDLQREAEAARVRAQAAGGAVLAIYRREYEASFDAFTGQIYVVATRHVFSEPVHPSQYVEIVGGYDWGRGHAGCLLMIGVREDGGYDVVSEDYGSGRLAQSWIRALRERVGYWGSARSDLTIYSDPSSPILPDMRDAELPIEPARKREVLAGIEKIADLLGRSIGGRPALRIHSSCANLLREMQGYRWDSGDQPVKQADDACDALRYALASHGRDPYWPIV